HRPLGSPPMQRLSTIDHAEERREFYACARSAGPLDQSGDHPQRQHVWNGGREHRVGGSEDTFRQQREACRAIEKDELQLAAKCVEERPDQAFWLAKGTEESVDLAIGEVSRDQVQIVIIGFLDGGGQCIAVLERSLAEPCHARLHAKSEAGGGLRVEIPE